MKSILHRSFGALGDETRFAIVERLLDNGPLSAGDLQTVSAISAPAISRHLKVLRNAGVITQSIDKQRRIYAIDPDAMQAISEWTLSHKEFWLGGLDRLEAAMKAHLED
jgi:DNA-binding transcriptional ArsR family regulator